MIPLVDHRLSEIERRNPGALEPGIVEQHFVHTGFVAEGLSEQIAQADTDVIGVQHRVFTGETHSVRAVAEHVGQRAHVHTHLTMECREPTERMRARRIARVFDQPIPRLVLGNKRKRGEWCQRFGQHNGTRAWTTAAVRRRERLVQIDVHGIDAEITWAHLADDRIEVRAVAVEVGACVVHGLGNLDDFRLE